MHCTILKDVSWGLGIVDGFVGRWEWGEEQKRTKKKETSSKCHWWFSSQEKISQGKLDFNCKDSLIPEGISNVAVSLLYSKLRFWSCILWETPFFSSLSRLTWKRRYWNCFYYFSSKVRTNKKKEEEINYRELVQSFIPSLFRFVYLGTCKSGWKFKCLELSGVKFTVIPSHLGMWHRIKMLERLNCLTGGLRQCILLWQRAHTGKISFRHSLWCQIYNIKLIDRPNYLVILIHGWSTTISLEPYSLFKDNMM